ncbi:mannose-1-phosphate guanylyltransferase/mannose-6-phosphate isomerase [Aquabacterium sp.]|uniref:mannose-1-phosphate guanylyltransferase/mannose-6-phosphate isomerase n=1 Tax=Aquabacterium sp. TaxID=1872578 RepID=UPI0035B3E0C6
MTLQIVPVIMAGGSGTRLWPLSRALYPKQFLVLHGNESLFQQAHRRLQALAGEGIEVAAPCVVGNEEHRFLVLDQLREQGASPSSLLLEPVGRNTAPAVALAAHAAMANGQDPIMVVAPADQTVTDEAAFVAAVREAARAAEQGDIVILGIQPDSPQTGYGYIRTQGSASDVTRAVAAFVEKPNAETAQRYLAEGGYYWNSGLFVMRASRWLAALQHFRPDIAHAVAAAWSVRKTDGTFVRPGKEEFAAVPAESVDYAVLEKCPETPQAGFNVKMVPLNAGWSDLGAWDAVWQVSERDASGNVAQGDAIFHNTRNTLVHSTSRLVSAVGVDNIVVVETPDAVLVADRDSSQDVKKIVSALQEQGRTEGTLHRRVHRPWGWYDSIDAGPRFQVKRIMVKPKATLSLQMHHHRAEHWIVVSGTAEVTCGDKVTLLGENQSTYIPLGETHRLANPGTIPLEIIEVQSGSYLGEDDIVRFEDKYGR